MADEIAQIELDPEPGGTPAPELYVASERAPSIATFDDIGEAEQALFHQQGYLVIEQAFNAAEVADAIAGMLALIGGKYPGFRGIQYEKNTRAKVASLPAEQQQDSVRKLMKFVEFEPHLAALAEHPHLINLVTQLIGDQPILFQDMALLKPPLIGREKPWHQDNAYFNVPAESPVVGVWIALDEATPENGCMFVVPGSHRTGPVVHFRRRDWQICDTDVAAERAVYAQMPPGGALIFHGLLHHGTPPSHSPKRRRALQYHYKPASLATITPEERMAVFGGEALGATC